MPAEAPGTLDSLVGVPQPQNSDLRRHPPARDNEAPIIHGLGLCLQTCFLLEAGTLGKGPGGPLEPLASLHRRSLGREEGGIWALVGS